MEGAGKPPSADFNQKKSADEPLRKRRGSGTLARGMNFMQRFVNTVAQPRRRQRAAGTIFWKKIRCLGLPFF